MIKIKRIVSMVVAAVCLLGFNVQTTSANTPIRIFVEGNHINLRDANGRTIHPLVIDGTTFLPVRAIGEAFGRQVNWDGNSQSVFVGNRPANVPSRGDNIRVFIDGSQITPRDAAGRVAHPFIRDGTTFLPLRAVGEAFGKSVHWDARNNSVIIGRGTMRITSGGNTHVATVADIAALNPRAVTQTHRGEVRNFRGVPMQALFSRLGVQTSGRNSVSIRSEDGFSTEITIAEALNANNAFIVTHDGAGAFLGTSATGGSGPFMNVMAQDEFANRSARYIIEIVLS